MPYNPYEIVRRFEHAVAEYTGSPDAVAVDSGTSALFLCCRYLKVAEVRIPSRTFFSVPCQILHAGGSVVFEDCEWAGAYQLKPWPIWDSALRFRAGMYVPGTFACLSFDVRKHLPIGRGGMILTDDVEAARWFRLARFHGRHEVPRMEDTPEFAGWKMHMYPEDALRGLQLLDLQPLDNPDIDLPYPDLSRFDAYRSDGSPAVGHNGNLTPAPAAFLPAGRLVPLNIECEAHLDLTWRLLRERYEDGCVNIPGETPGVPLDPLQPQPPLPTRAEHVRHLQSVAGLFEGAYIWRENEQDAGFVFLRPATSAAGGGEALEIGVFVLRAFRHRGIGEAAVSQMLDRHQPPRVIARINPRNQPSNRLFERLGFHHVCNVWARDGQPAVVGSLNHTTESSLVAEPAGRLQEGRK